MKSTKSRRVGVAAVAVATAVATIGTAATASAAAPSESVVIGSAGGTLDFSGWEGQPVRFDFAAHGVPAKSAGRFHVNHVLTDGSPFADVDGRVDCVSSVGNLAILTGVIEHADLPGVPGLNLVGRRVGFSVQDNTHGTTASAGAGVLLGSTRTSSRAPVRCRSSKPRTVAIAERPA
jgi:hypothetical protein